MVKIFLKKYYLLGVTGLALFLATLTSGQAFAAAGSGSTVSSGASGGNCHADYGTTFDTCYGGSWRFYRIDSVAYFRDRYTTKGEPTYYDKETDSIRIPDASGNVPGGVISRCAADGSVGFFAFGLEVYRPKESHSSPTASAGYQAGLIQKGSLRNVFDSAPDYDRDIIPANTSEIPTFFTTIPHGSTFSDEAMRRLFGFVETSGHNDGYSWDDPSLAWICSGAFDAAAEFNSNSNVRLGPNTSNYATTNWANNTTANKSESVESGASISAFFSHAMKFTGKLPLQVEENGVKKDIDKPYAFGITISDPDNIVASITPSSASSPTIPSPPSPPSPTIPSPFKPTDDKAKDIIASHEYKITFNKITDPKDTKPRQVTICERIDYKNRSYENSKWSNDSNYSRACANITVTPDPIPEDISTSGLCTALFSDYSPTIDSGVTLSISQVRSLSKPDAWKMQDDTLWSKPGDNIQFRHVLCPGAQAPRKSSTHGAHGHTSTSNLPREAIVASANSCSIKAESPNSSYWFGSDSSACTPPRGDSSEIVRHSPSNGSTAYSCKVAEFPSHIASGYQLPGFATRRSNCSSSNSPLLASVAGKTIKQSMTVGGTMSATAVNEGLHSWSHTDSYACGGMVNDVYVPGICSSTHDVAHSDDYYSGKTTLGTLNTYAQVKIPYNYTTTTSVTVPTVGNGINFGGADITVAASAKLHPRKDNPEIEGNYSTLGKPLAYEVVALEVGPDDAKPGHFEDRIASGGSGQPACSHYQQGSIRVSCQSIARGNTTYDGKTTLNSDGSLIGSPEELLASLSVNIPDREVGTKFCIALGVWPANSHDTGAGQAPTKAQNETIAMQDDGNTWNYSKPICVTIAKKPTVQFWGQSLYANGGITTSITKKKLDSTLANTLNPGDTTDRRVFGSWSEYDTIAGGRISGFATGAGFGYNINNKGGQNATVLTSASAIYKPGGYKVSYNTAPNPCVYSYQTFNNASTGATNSCTSLGNSAINNVDIASTLTRLSSRYITTEVPPTSSTITKDSFTTLQNNIKYARVEGAAVIANNLCIDSSYILDVTGDLTINGNIYYRKPSSAACNTSDAYSDESYANISDLPQLLIFANSITISATPTNIDAWLIAGREGKNIKGDGRISTCPNTPTDSTECANILTINGPIFASNLILNRTHGALPGINSIDPAEIFNLRLDTYLWAYSQAQNFSQAVTTYSRELAPRF